MPVCATTGLTMKQAMKSEETRFLCEQILSECIHAAKKIGYEYESNFFENCLAYLENAGDHKLRVSPLTGNLEGRKTDNEITLFKSLGLAVEDIASAEYIYQKALEQDMGTSVELGGKRSSSD